MHLVTAAPGSAISAVAGATRYPPVAPSDTAPPDTTPPPATPANDYQYAPPPAATLSLPVGQVRTQYLGAVLSVTGVDVPVQSGPSGAGASLRVGLLSPDGRRTTWIGSAPLGPSRAGTAVVSAPGPTPASGVVLEPEAGVGAGMGAPGPLGIGAVVLRTAGQGTYRVDGSLRDSVTPARWRFAGMIGVFCVFTEASAAGRAWVQGGSGAAPVSCRARPGVIRPSGCQRRGRPPWCDPSSSPPAGRPPS